jgi:hypothetical protein
MRPGWDGSIVKPAQDLAFLLKTVDQHYKDTMPGEVLGQAVNGVWFVVNATDFAPPVE